MDFVKEILREIVYKHWNTLVMIIIVLLSSLFLSKLRKLTDWVKRSKAIITFMELGMMVFLMILTYHCFLEHFAGDRESELYINPMHMVIMFVVSTIASIVIYLITAYFLQIIQSKRK